MDLTELGCLARKLVIVSLAIIVMSCGGDDSTRAPVASAIATAHVPTSAGRPSPTSTGGATTEASTTTDVATTTDAVSTTVPTTTIDPDCPRSQDPISSLTVDVAGQMRTALVHMPNNQVPTAPSAVVLSFHGATDNTGKLNQWDGLAELADQEGFIVVHPQGSAVEIVPGAPVDPGWDVLGLAVDEAAFVRQLLDALSLSVCVDDQRVFATGFSNGGALALSLSCTLGERVAAVAAVESFPLHQCPSAQPTPTVIFHGLEDRFVPYGGDATIGLPSIEQMAADVATRNGCAAAAPVVTTITQGVDELAWDGCGAATILYRIAGNGHAWPGAHFPAYAKEEFAELLRQSGAVPAGLTAEQAADNIYLSSPAIDATAVMWEFFTSHS